MSRQEISKSTGRNDCEIPTLDSKALVLEVSTHKYPLSFLGQREKNKNHLKGFCFQPHPFSLPIQSAILGDPPTVQQNSQYPVLIFNKCPADLLSP